MSYVERDMAWENSHGLVCSAPFGGVDGKGNLGVSFAGVCEAVNGGWNAGKVLILGGPQTRAAYSTMIGAAGCH